LLDLNLSTRRSRMKKTLALAAVAAAIVPATWIAVA
jgi:hypothetical protein